MDNKNQDSLPSEAMGSTRSDIMASTFSVLSHREDAFKVMASTSASSSSVFVQRGSDGWQLNKTFMERQKYMYKTKLTADVSFLVGPHECGEPEEIWAHRYMLVSSSPVFEAMFDPSWTGESSGEKARVPAYPRIDIPDILPSAFNEMLRFIYYEDAKISAQNAFGILYASKKYQLPGLEDLSKSFIVKNICIENVCMFLDQSLDCAEDTLTYACLRYIESHATSVLESNHILSLSKSALLKITEADDLKVDDERMVYEACMRWATEQCRDGDSMPSDQSIRACLGEVLYTIRFPCMGKEDLLIITQNTNVLSKDEKIEIYESMLGPKGAENGLFHSRPRRNSPADSVLVQMSRYKTVTRGFWLARKCKTTHAISFVLDHSATLVGIGMFESISAQPNHTLTEIYDQNQVLVARISGQILTKSHYNHRCQDYEFVICGWHFPDPVPLAAGQLYTVIAMEIYPKGTDDISATIGMNGLPKITSNGLTIRFVDAKNISHNGTKVNTGQIPQLIFKFNPQQ